MSSDVGKIIVAAAVTAAVTYITAGTGTVAAGSFFASIGFTAGVSSIAVASAVVSFAATAALGFANAALTPKPTLPSFDSLPAKNQGSVRQIQAPVTSWKFPYGETRISGTVLFADSTENNKYMHLVIGVSGEEIDEFMFTFLDEAPIYNDQLDGDNIVSEGRYTNKVRIKYHLGSTTQVVDNDLETEIPGWTSDHRIRGRAYVYLRFEFDRDIYPAGLPNISFWARGLKLFDPRTSTIGWSNNNSSVIRNYITKARSSGGMGFSAADDVDDTFFISAANSCEEIVDTDSISMTVTSVDTTNNTVVFSGDDDFVLKFLRGDRLRVTSTGSNPGGLTDGVDFYAISVKPRKTDSADLELAFAASYTNSLTPTLVDITDVGSGTITITKTGEPRYTCNGIINTSTVTGGNLENLLQSMVGRASHIGENWKIYAGVVETATLLYDEDDVVGTLEIITELPLKDRFNGIKGTYVSPLNNSIVADYPSVTNTTYEAEDGGQILRDVDLHFTDRPYMAQRIVKIMVERARQTIAVEALLKLTALKFQPGTIIKFSNTRFGWEEKEFECVEWNFQTISVTEDAVAFVIPVTLSEYTSAIFTTLPTETLVDPAPNTNLPNPFEVIGPTGLQYTEELYVARSGGGVKARVILTWQASVDSFVTGYIVEHKLSSDTDWVVLPETPDITINIDDIAAGVYDFRVKAINYYRTESDYIPLTDQEVLGLSAKPTAPQNLTISSIGGMALLRWTKSTDLDVTEGGVMLIKHDKDKASPGWTTSVTVGDPIDGADTFASVPLKEGSYLLRFRDTSRVLSDIVTVATDQATAIEYTNLSSISEHSTFSGTHTNTVVTGGNLQLAGADQMDDWTDVDSVPDWDTGQSGVASSGTYEFAASFDFGSVVRKRLTTVIDVLILASSDLIDSRITSIDDWLDFDGTEGADADAVVFVRHTPDDPSGSPTWSTWERLESAEFEDRAFQFKVELTTVDVTYNIQVSELTINSENVA